MCLYRPTLHFHITLTLEETIQAKTAFEMFVARHGVKIQQYHADNSCIEEDTLSVTAKITSNILHTVEAMLTSNTKFLKETLGMLKQKSRSFFSMLLIIGQEWWI